MAKRKTAEKPKKPLRSKTVAVANGNSDYTRILTDMKQLITDSRHRAAATVNRELVCLYWNIGRVIVEQQETASWGDAVVEQLANDLRLAFPDMKGLSRTNVFLMRQFVRSCRDINRFLKASANVEHPQRTEAASEAEPIQTASGLSQNAAGIRARNKIQTPSGLILSADFLAEFIDLILRLSWSHHSLILQCCQTAEERYFYMQMSVRERWSVRELRRQIDAALYARYMSVKSNPEACLPKVAEHGDLQPFKDHYVLEFLGLAEEHSEKELRKAILGNLRDFFLEFGKDLSFVGEEYPVTVGGESFYIDLLFYHRRLQCLIAIDLKKGKFKPAYVGQSQFYVAALDEQVRLPHENPSIALILCRDANHVQVKLALSVAAKKIGIATYQTALPDEQHIQQRLQQLPPFAEQADENEDH